MIIKQFETLWTRQFDAGKLTSLSDPTDNFENALLLTICQSTQVKIEASTIGHPSRLCLGNQAAYYEYDPFTKPQHSGAIYSLPSIQNLLNRANLLLQRIEACSHLCRQRIHSLL